jgi:60 kDa SS-A/Ro ribonucleoprotein
VDVAALFAASILRKNRSAVVMPFDTILHPNNLNGRDTVLTNASRLAKFGGGGTDCSLPLAKLNLDKAKGDAVIYVSDCESWVDSPRYYRGTGMMTEWLTFKKRNPKAKLICIDLTPRSNSQVQEHKDILQVGGFSDQVFDVVASFIEHGDDKNHWVKLIEDVSLDG